MKGIKIRRGWRSCFTSAAVVICLPIIYAILKYEIDLIKTTAKHQHLELRKCSTPTPPSTSKELGLQGTIFREETYQNQSKTIAFKLNMNRRHIHPWNHSSSETCRKFATHFCNASTLPVYPLASYPGSGNTWVRYLLEGLSGVFTGDIYKDKRLARIFLGSKENYRVGTTFGTKTHRKAYEYPMKLNKDSKVLLIVRNPFEALISYFQLTLTKSHTKKVPPIKFTSERWRWFVNYAIFWDRHIRSWITCHRSHILVIYYEELKDNLEDGLREIQQFLGFEPNQERLECVLRERDGSYKRSTRIKKHFPFQDFQVEYVLGYLRNVSQFLEKEQIKPLPLDLYMKSLTSKFTPESLGNLDLVKSLTHVEAT